MSECFVLCLSNITITISAVFFVGAYGFAMLSESVFKYHTSELGWLPHPGQGSTDKSRAEQSICPPEAGSPRKDKGEARGR